MNFRKSVPEKQRVSGTVRQQQKSAAGVIGVTGDSKMARSGNRSGPLFIPATRSAPARSQDSQAGHEYKNIRTPKQ